MNLIRASYRFVKHTLLADLYRLVEFRSAKNALLRSDALSGEEKTLLRTVSLRVHPNDGMYRPSAAEHYLSVGLSALRAIEGALTQAGSDHDVRSILDFPCGYGRVLRFLRARFPAAAITASEIDTVASAFCRRAFSAKTIESNTDFRRLSSTEKFDLIWCGSLITHMEEKATVDLLKFFHDHLSIGGVCVFTTHGQLTAESMRKNARTYGLSATALQQVLAEYHDRGYGYADYSNRHGYGISVVSRERMQAIAHTAGPWHETFYMAHGWDNHQDVYAFAHRVAGRTSISERA